MFDKRLLVSSFDTYPFVTNCYLESTYDSYCGRGTATLISPYCLVTAGHNLWHDQKFPTNITCLLGMKGNMATESAVVSAFYVHPKYLESENSDYDIGIVRIEKPFGNTYGSMSLNVPDVKDIIGMAVNVTGYPAQKKFREILFNRQSTNMYTMNGIVRSITEHQMHYEIDTSGGQSGAGVWVKDQENNVDCIAVHTHGNKIDGNGAVRITQESGKILTEWLLKLETDEMKQVPLS